MCHHRAGRDRPGVSLVEVLVAISIAAFAFFPILRLFSHSMGDSMRIASYAHARELAAKVMDETLAHPFGEFRAGSSATFADGYALPRNETRAGTEFEIAIEVADLDPTWHYRTKNLADVVSDVQEYKPPSNELKRVEIRVSWKGVAERQSYVLKALKADLFE